MEQNRLTNKYIRALLENDSLVLMELYDKYFPTVIGLCKSWNRDFAYAKDVMNISLMAIYKLLGDNKIQLDEDFEFGKLLYTVTRNHLRNEARKDKNRDVVTLPEDDTYIDDVRLDIQFEQLEQQALFDKHLMEMGEPCQQVILLSLRGNNAKEIAEILKIKHPAARQHKSRCRKKLIQSIQNDPTFEELRDNI